MNKIVIFVFILIVQTSTSASQSTSFFSDVSDLNDNVLETLYARDSFQGKIDLNIGEYRKNEDIPWMLPVVAKTQIAIASNRSLSHRYLPSCGIADFTAVATELLLGVNSPAIRTKRIASIQTLSGTGALHMGAKFLTQRVGLTTIYISRPTYYFHNRTLRDGGFQDIREYRYWDNATLSVDFAGLMADLGAAAGGSVILLQACGHNPTGVDLSRQQWRRVAALMRRRRLVPFFDVAYQGLVSGDPERDIWPVRHFERACGFEMLIAQSFSKSMGLYNERIGNLVIVQHDASTVPRVLSHLATISDAMLDSPPAYGSRIVATVLSDAALRAEWLDALLDMSAHLGTVRRSLYAQLQLLGTARPFGHIVDQVGMYMYTGLAEAEVRHLRERYHVYCRTNSRINVCGINERNVAYVARAIHETVSL